MSVLVLVVVGIVMIWQISIQVTYSSYYTPVWLDILDICKFPETSNLNYLQKYPDARLSSILMNGARRGITRTPQIIQHTLTHIV